MISLFDSIKMESFLDNDGNQETIKENKLKLFPKKNLDNLFNSNTLFSFYFSIPNLEKISKVLYKSLSSIVFDYPSEYQETKKAESCLKKLDYLADYARESTNSIPFERISVDISDFRKLKIGDRIEEMEKDREEQNKM